METSDNQSENMQGVAPPKVRTDAAVVGSHAEMPHMLVSVGDFGAQQNDHPAELEPHQKEGQGSETSVYGIGLGNQNLGVDVYPLKNLVKRAGDNAGYQGR